MIRLALRSVRARWGRVVLTALAIVASTAFLSGTFIFRDTIERTFDALFADVFERVDGYVQSSRTRSRTSSGSSVAIGCRPR